MYSPLEIGTVGDIYRAGRGQRAAEDIAIRSGCPQVRVRGESGTDLSEERAASGTVVVRHFRQLRQPDEQLTCPFDELVLLDCGKARDGECRRLALGRGAASGLEPRVDHQAEHRQECDQGKEKKPTSQVRHWHLLFLPREMRSR